MELHAIRVSAAVAATLCAILASATVLAADPAPKSPDSSATDPNGPADAPMSPSDARAAQEVNARLNADPKHFFRHVKVSVHDGVARLSGFVDTSDAIYQAQELARGTPGVTKVENQMRVERNGNNSVQPD
jgi:osmotically-inducible protein OsmY